MHNNYAFYCLKYAVNQHRENDSTAIVALGRVTRSNFEHYQSYLGARLKTVTPKRCLPVKMTMASGQNDRILNTDLLRLIYRYILRIYLSTRLKIAMLQRTKNQFGSKASSWAHRKPSVSSCLEIISQQETYAFPLGNLQVSLLQVSALQKAKGLCY